MNERLPAGRRPIGAAETTIVSKQRPIVDELRRMSSALRPPYTSSSAFAFAFDDLSERDPADVSAVANHVGAHLNGVFEQPFVSPDGPEPGPVQPTRPTEDELQGEETGAEGAQWAAAGAETVADPGDGTGSGPARTGEPTSSNGGQSAGPPPPDPNLPSIEKLLAQPAGVSSRELAERASQALKKQWYRDAERLFVAATKANPTDPFAWFGAGLAAKDRSPRQAAAYLMRAAKYLQPDDPGGSAYAAIMASELLVSANQSDTARRVLGSFADGLPDKCPAILLHLARLEPDSAARVRDAINSDPMMEADVLALGIDFGHVAIDDRRQVTRSEMERIGQSILDLRRVGGIPPDPLSTPDRLPTTDDRLPLAWAEMNLWRRIELCDREMDDARRRLESRSVAREEAEDIESKKASVAAGDLQSSATLPFFLFSMATVAAVLITYALGRWLSAGSPRFAAPISLTMWFVILCLLVLAFSVASAVWRPFREIALARDAKAELPIHEYLVAQRRFDEINVRRSYRQASQRAELVLQRTVGRRSVIVPRRPIFRSGDLPVVPARR
ncbi:MAG: tetratricopeptide repeat protein [Acidimicrobiales bacterium]